MRIMLLANASSPLLRSWVSLNDNHELILISTKEKADFVPETTKYVQIKSKLGVVFSYVKLLFKIRKIIRKFNPDLIISHYISTHGIIALLSKFNPLISVIYGSDVFYTGKFLNPLIKRTIEKSKLVFVAAEPTKLFVIEKYNVSSEKIIVSDWGINISEFNLKARETREPRSSVLEEFNLSIEGNYIISPRNIREAYNQDIIIEGFSHIVKDNPQYKLIMLYYKERDNSYLKFLQDLARKLGIENEIIWITRSLSDKEMSDVFSFAEVLINIPKTDQISAALLEGISCGCFPIVSDLEPYYQIIENEVNGIISKCNPVNIKQSFEYYLENKDFLQKNLKKNATVVKSTFTINRFNALLEKKLIEILG